MTRYEVYVGQQWRGTVEADTESEARKVARKGGLWVRGEGASTVLQRIETSKGKVTSRTAQDRTKSGELAAGRAPWSN
jgi:hypothetical protein